MQRVLTFDVKDRIHSYLHNAVIRRSHKAQTVVMRGQSLSTGAIRKSFTLERTPVADWYARPARLN
jgi:hypothetical protein